MAQEKFIIKSLPLAHTKNGTITLTHITEPYGPKSEPIVSIGISLKGDLEEPDWKAHVPYDNLDEVIAALQDAKRRFGS